jgi:hypothetical protein
MSGFHKIAGLFKWGFFRENKNHVRKYSVSFYVYLGRSREIITRVNFWIFLEAREGVKSGRTFWFR